MATAVAAVGMGASALGGIFGAVGAEETAQANYQMNQYQAAIASENANISLQNAEYARQAGEVQAQQVGLQGAQVYGQTVASEASSGLDVNSGSAKQVQQSQRTITGINLDTVRSNAALTAYNYDVQASQYQNQAKLYRLAGTNALQAGNIGAASSLIGSASSVSTEWLQASAVGAVPGGSSTAQLSLFNPNPMQPGIG